MNNQLLSSRFGWSRSLDALKLYHERLHRAARVNCNYVELAPIYVGRPSDAVPWLGTASELVHLHALLVDKKVLPYTRNATALLCLLYCRPDGRAFNPQSMKTLKARGANFFVAHFVRDLLDAFEKLEH